MNPIRNEADLDSLFRSVRAYAVLSAWAEMGCIERLATADMVAISEMGMDSRSIEITAPVLCHMGLLRVTPSHVGLTRAAKDLWESGALKLSALENSIGVLTQMGTILQEGGPARRHDGGSLVTEGGVREDDLDDTRRFMKMLYRRSEYSATAVASFLKAKLSPGSNILDLGGGHGRYGEALVDAGMSVTLYDRPVCVKIAKERYNSKMEYREGDFLKEPIEGAFDCVVLSNIVHGLGPEELSGVFRSLRACLSPGGSILIKDMFIDGHYAHPENAVFFGLTMLLYTREGRSYTIPQMTSMLTNTGYDTPEHLFDSDGGFSFLLSNITSQ